MRFTRGKPIEMSIYKELAKTTIPPTDQSELMLEILALAMTPEEAEIIMALPSPTVELAKKFGLEEKAVEAKIHDFMKRGLVHLSPEGPSFFKVILLLRDEILTSDPALISIKMVRLWKEYVRTVLQYELSDFLINTKPPIVRIVPARKAVPKDVALLPHEDVHEIIKAAKTATVRDCCCRVQEERCDLPIHTCIQFNERADYAVLRGGAKDISLDEVLEIQSSAEDAGLVPMVANVARMDLQNYICMCCGCCCVTIDPLKRFNKLKTEEGLARSRFQADVAGEECIGCGKCVKRCQFDAIKMIKVKGEKKPKAHIDPALCYGCGVCVLTCKPEALTLKLIRPPEHIPREHHALIL